MPPLNEMADKQEIDRTIAAAEEAQRRNLASIAKLEELQGRVAERINAPGTENGEALARAIEDGTLPPPLAEALRQQLDEFKRRCRDVLEQSRRRAKLEARRGSGHRGSGHRGGTATSSVGDKTSADPHPEETPIEELTRIIGETKHSLARFDETFAAVDVSPQKAAAILRGNHLPPQALQAARHKIAELETAAGKVGRAGKDKPKANRPARRPRKTHLAV